MSVRIKTIDGEKYKLCLISNEFVYYMDDEGNVAMYNKKGKLLSDNYFAGEAMINDISNNKVKWASKSMKYNIKEMKKDGVV